MTEPYPYQPIIRLPKSKSGNSPTRSNRRSTIQPVSSENGQCIVSETLYFDGLENTISEDDIRNLLHRCQPTEVVIHQGQGSGYLVFSDPKMADRVYSLYNGFTFPDGKSKLQFRIYQDDGSYEPEPKGPILQVKNLPLKIDNNALYEMFRPFGPLSLCKPIVEGKGFRGTAFVQYFYQEDSDMAQSSLDGKIVDGNTINVVSFMPSKTRNASVAEQGNKTTPLSNVTTMPTTTEKQEGGGYVDYMNLYIKNLDPAIGNNELFNLFRRFGRIVSARVMSNPATGQSKGYGFVSYDKQEEAAAALQEMNGKMVMSKALIVAYHEPKKPRQEKQQQQQQQNQPPVSSSPLVNPLQNYMGPIGTPVRTSPHIQDYTQGASAAAAAAAAGAATGIGAPAYMSHDTTRHPYDMAMPPPPMNAVNGLGIDNVDQIALSMKTIGQKRPSPPNPLHRKFSAAESSYGQHPLRLSPPFSASPMSGVSSTGPSLASLASGLNVQPRPNFPQHQEYNTRENGRPSLRRKGSLESISSVMTESSASIQRQRLKEAIMRCGDYGNNVNDIVDMLLTLKRKERSLCLFNQDFLREKIHLALEALETFNDGTEEEEGAVYVQNVPAQGHNPTTSLHQGSISPIPRSNGFVQTQPRVSKAIPIVPPPAAASNPSSTKTNGESSNNTSNNGNSNQSIEESVREIEKLLESLEGKPIHEKKQQLGDRLFPLVKATGTKQAPKVTIRLLDTIDLHELARLMYDKVQLKERVDAAFAALK